MSSHANSAGSPAVYRKRPARRAAAVRTALSLDRQIERARGELQWTREDDPAFEKRLATLIALLQQREQAR